MRGIIKRTLSGAMAILFVLAYTGPVMLCGEACAAKTVAMSCCGAPTEAGTSALSHKCCCDIKEGGKEAIPPSAAANSGQDMPRSNPAMSMDTVAYARLLVTRAGTAPIFTNTKPPPIYTQTCSYLC